MVNETPSEGPKFSEPTGAILRPISSERKMRIYAVPENELKHISMLNTQAIAFASVGSGLVSFVVAIIIDALMEFGTLMALQDAASILVYYFAPILGLLSVVFFAMCWHALFTKGSMINTIKSESVIIED